MLISSKRRIATLIDLIGEVKGRVELQKIIFILQNEGVDFNMMYSYNVYGPFSEDLQIEIDNLSSEKDGIISEEKIGDETFRTYKIKSNGLSYTDDELIKKKGELVTYLGRLNRDELELISSIYYFKNLNYSDTMIENKVSSLKSRIFAGFADAKKKYLDIKTKSEEYSSMV